MRKLLLIMMIFLSLHADDISVFAQKMGYETSYEAAVYKAKSEKKNLMFLLVTHYCPWCIKFEKKTLSSAKVDKAIHEKYVPLILNRQKGKFPKKFDAKRIPTVFFIDPHNESLLHQSVGYKNKRDFREELQKAEK